MKIFNYCSGIKGHKIIGLKTFPLILFLCSPLLCSFSSPEYISFEYHALTNAVKIVDGNGVNIESQQIGTGGLGHAYIVVRNFTNSSIKVGYYSLSVGSSVSVGLWSDGAICSSSSSSFGSSGILYDYESWFYTTKERPRDEAYVKRNISSSKLDKVSQLIKNKNSTYNLVTYNCATFATEAYNIATDSGFYTGWFRSPINCRDEIVAHYSDHYEYNYSLTTKYNFSHYNTSLNRMENYYL